MRRTRPRSCRAALLFLVLGLLLTPDVQVIGPSQKQRFVSILGRESIGTATVLGVRLQLLL